MVLPNCRILLTFGPLTCIFVSIFNAISCGTCLMKKVILFLFCLLSVSNACASSGDGPCQDDEDDKTFLASSLAKVFAPQKAGTVTITHGDLRAAECAFLRHAHLEDKESNAGFIEAQKDHLHKTVAQRLMGHTFLQGVHLTFEMDRKHLPYYGEALTVKLFNAAGELPLRALSLDITSLARLSKSATFVSAFLKAQALEEVNIHNIDMGEDETSLIGVLDLLSHHLHVRKLGLFGVPASLGGTSKLRLSWRVLSILGLKQYETLTLDTLGVEGIEEHFIAYLRGPYRPLRLRVKGDFYVTYSCCVGPLRAALHRYGRGYQTLSGKIFAFYPTLKTHREIKGAYVR